VLSFTAHQRSIRRDVPSDLQPHSLAILNRLVQRHRFVRQAGVPAMPQIAFIKELGGRPAYLPVYSSTGSALWTHAESIRSRNSMAPAARRSSVNVLASGVPAPVKPPAFSI
jgi:hypothetical protein